LNVHSSLHADEGDGATVVIVMDADRMFIIRRRVYYLYATDTMKMEAPAMQKVLTTQIRRTFTCSRSNIIPQWSSTSV
jgi:hypothetical protein